MDGQNREETPFVIWRRVFSYGETGPVCGQSFWDVIWERIRVLIRDVMRRSSRGFHRCTYTGRYTGFHMGKERKRPASLETVLVWRGPYTGVYTGGYKGLQSSMAVSYTGRHLGATFGPACRTKYGEIAAYIRTGRKVGIGAVCLMEGREGTVEKLRG